MRALVYTGNKRVEMLQFPDPSPAPGQVLLKVRATGICGSDVHGFLGLNPRRKPGLVLGHETTGVVERLGEGVDASLLGKRVAVNPLISCTRCRMCMIGRHSCCDSWRLLGLDATHGSFADYVVVPQRNVRPLPDHVTDKAAVMVEPLSNAFHLLSHLTTEQPLLSTCVIFGGGTLGACILAVAQARGLQVLAVSEPNPARAKVMQTLGAPRVLDPRQTNVVEQIKSMTGGRGVEVSIDAVGRDDVRQASIALVARGGTVLLLGNEHGPSTLDFADLIRREVRLQTSYAYAEKDFHAACDFVERGAVDFSPWTDLVPLEEGQAAFDRLVTNPGDRIKIALTL